MTNGNKVVKETGIPQAISSVEQNEMAMKLVAELVAGNIVDIRPQLDFTSELSFSYPAVEQILKVKGKEVVSILESLVDKGILLKNFFDKFFRCPQ